MFIRDSRKLLRVLGAVALVAAMYVVLDLPLRRLSVWAETSADSYPWPDEDYLRYLLPTLFDGRPQNRLLIAGPSEAREDLLYEPFEAAFPDMETYQGGIGGGALQDLLAALEYIRLEYGTDALPSRILLGITPRFVANLPRTPAPVVESITRYSLRWKAVDSPQGPVLERKNVLRGVAGRFSFTFKQQARYKSAICAATLRLLQGDEGTAKLQPPPPGSGLSEQVEWRLYLCRSPYRYQHARVKGTAEGARSWLTNPNSLWPQVHAWDPYSERTMVEAQLGRVVQFAREHAIALYVVNLPEHPENQAQYDDVFYERYLEIVHSVIGDTPFLDLRDLLEATDYVDHAHADFAGAMRVTDQTIRFLTTAEQERTRSAERIVQDNNAKRPEGI